MLSKGSCLNIFSSAAVPSCAGMERVTISNEREMLNTTDENDPGPEFWPNKTGGSECCVFVMVGFQ